MLTTVRLSPHAIKIGKKLTLNIGKYRITLSAESPQLDLKGLDLLALERSLISGEIRGYVAAKMLHTVQVLPADGSAEIQTGNPVGAGAAGGIKPVLTTEQSTAAGPAKEGVDMLPPAAQQAAQLVSGGNVVVRHEEESKVPPMPLKPTQEAVGTMAPDSATVASVKAPGEAGAEAEEVVEEKAPEAAKLDPKTADAAPAWKADKTLIQQEAVLNTATDKEFLASVVADPNEGDRLKLVAEKRLQSL